MQLLTLKKAGELFGVPYTTFKYWVTCGFVPAWSRGKQTLVAKEAVDEIIDSLIDLKDCKERILKEKAALREEKERFYTERKKLSEINGLSKVFNWNISRFLEERLDYTKREYRRSYQALLLYVKGASLTEVGEMLDVSTQRAQQIVAKALRILKHSFPTLKQMEDLKENHRNDVCALKTEISILREKNAKMEGIIKARFPDVSVDELVAEEEDELLKNLHKDPRKIRLLSTRVYDLGFSVRTINCLKSAEVETLLDLVKYKPKELMRFRNFGKKSLKEIIDFLDTQGLSLQMDIDNFVKLPQ